MIPIGHGNGADVASRRAACRSQRPKPPADGGRSRTRRAKIALKMPIRRLGEKDVHGAHRGVVMLGYVRDSGISHAWHIM